MPPPGWENTGITVFFASEPPHIRHNPDAMTVISHLLAIEELASVPPRPGADVGVAVEEVVPSKARREIASVVEACRAPNEGMGGRLSARGMVAELAGREGRRHRVWLARAGCRTVGLVSLTATTPGPRYSISWLLVHPSCRRRGVGGRLVHEAIAAVREAGGRAVHVETLASWADAVAFWSRFT